MKIKNIITVYFSTIFNAYHSKPYHFTPDMTILDFPFALLASPLQTFPNSTTDSLVTTSGFKQGGAQCSKAQSFALPNVGLPCLKLLVVSKASIFCHFWRFGEERPRVGGEETRGEEKERTE
jgi:hypothetical protein